MTNRTYPQGVPCWVDTAQPDVEAATEFYGGIFGWTFEDAMPPGAPGRYAITKLDGQDVGAIAGPGRVPRLEHLHFRRRRTCRSTATGVCWSHGAIWRRPPWERAAAARCWPIRGNRVPHLAGSATLGGAVGQPAGRMEFQRSPHD